MAGFWLVFTGMSCGQVQRNAAMKYTSPVGYELNKPEVFKMDNALEEISGITFLHGNPDTIFAQQDEKGRLFFFALGDKKPKHTRFGKDGDYEDIAMLGDEVVMLRSDGSLYRFPVGERHSKQVESTTWHKPFPKGEYESLATRTDDNLLYILCKECEVDRKKPTTTGYGFRLKKGGEVQEEQRFTISHSQIEQHASLKGKSFRPSAMAWNPYTDEWYVISSINKLLVVLDSAWQVKEAHRLDPKLYRQPEGLAFDNNRTLYIASERGNTGDRGTIYKFSFTNN